MKLHKLILVSLMFAAQLQLFGADIAPRPNMVFIMADDLGWADVAFHSGNAPTPHLVVVPALQGNAALHEWLRHVAPETDVTMSVCTGAFQLAEAGLLDGLTATTHHDFYDSFADKYPDVTLERDVRFVENPRISTAGGLTSGIDLALRVVARYFGTEVAEQTAYFMEYSGTDWKV